MNDKQVIEERQKYVSAFNNTMIKIWKEQITLLGVIDSGALLRSPMSVGLSADGKNSLWLSWNMVCGKTMELVPKLQGETLAISDGSRNVSDADGSAEILCFRHEYKRIHGRLFGKGVPSSKFLRYARKIPKILLIAWEISHAVAQFLNFLIKKWSLCH